MSGLSDPEREGCRTMLALLNDDDIMALCDTITNRLVQPEDRQDAIRAILAYSQNVEELLKRKKVHRDVIFKYLASQGVIIPPATEKHSLIQHTKDYWKKQLHLKLKATPEPLKTSVDVKIFQQFTSQFLPLKCLICWQPDFTEKNILTTMYGLL